MIKDIEYLVPVLQVRDVEAASKFFQQLGFEEEWDFDDGDYAGLYCSDFVIHLQKTRGSEVVPMPLYIQVPDVDRLFGAATAAGLTIEEDLKDREYGMRDFSIVGPGGLRVTLGTEIDADSMTP